MDIVCGKIFGIIITNVLRHNLIEYFLPKIIHTFQKEVLTFNISTETSANGNECERGADIILNDSDVNTFFGISLKKTLNKYFK